MNNKPYIADFSLSAGMIIVSILVFMESLKLKPSEYEPLGPAALPKALSVGLLILSIPLIIQGITKYRAAKNRDTDILAEGDKRKPLNSLITAVSTIVYIFLIQFIGFRISTVILFVFLGVLLHKQEKKVSSTVFYPTLFVIALGMSQVLYLIFTRILIVNLP